MSDLTSCAVLLLEMLTVGDGRESEERDIELLEHFEDPLLLA